MPLPWDFSSDDSPIIYHYTSLEAARAIVESRTMRMSEHTAMNDASEFTYARNRLETSISNRELHTDLATRLAVVFALEGVADSTGLMIGSLTARRDDLGQWRSYASNGQGCVLGLDARYLEHDAGVAVRTVIYDEATVDLMLRLGVDVVQKQFEEAPEDRSTLNDYARHLAVDLFSMKHPCFADEREVRISRMVVRNGCGDFEDVGGNRTGGRKTPALAVEARDGSFGLTRHISLPLSRDDGSRAIVSVGFGPMMEPDRAAESSDFFEKHGIEVWRSTLPFRA